MAEDDGLLVAFPVRPVAAAAKPAEAGRRKRSVAAEEGDFRRRGATSTMYNTSFRRRQDLSVEEGMLECARVANRLLRLLETRREDVRASVGAPRRGMGGQGGARNVDAKRDRVLGTLRGHLRYYTAQCDAVQEEATALGEGDGACVTAFSCLPCCTARATLVARQRRAVADAICISVRRATREYRVVEVQAGEEASAMFKTLFEATEELAEVQSRLPKQAGRAPKRSACASCCLWFACCGCLWMDDGSASASIRARARAAVAVAASAAGAAKSAATARSTSFSGARRGPTASSPLLSRGRDARAEEYASAPAKSMEMVGGSR